MCTTFYWDKYGVFHVFFFLRDVMFSLMEEELRIVFIHYLQKYQILFNYFMQISFWVFISIDSMVQSLKFIKFKDIITLAYKTTEM